MVGPSEELRTRVLPAVLTAFGVTILSAGLLTYTVPVPAASDDPGASPSAHPSGAVVATPTPLITLPPIGTPEPTVTPSAQPTLPPKGRVATRVRIRDLGIDLAIVKGNTGYPFCNVAMYLPQLSQPGFNKATYLYAHAREGMFLPLLKTKSFDQRGLVVEVWTSDDWLYKYKITQVRRDQPFSTGLNDPAKAKSEQLWLQTSQGPGRQYGYTQVIAKPIGARPTDHDASHPTPRPVDCG
jgi:sortase family protein